MTRDKSGSIKIGSAAVCMVWEDYVILMVSIEIEKHTVTPLHQTNHVHWAREHQISTFVEIQLNAMLSTWLPRLNIWGSSPQSYRWMHLKVEVEDGA